MLIECGATRLLVDAGFAPRTLAERMEIIGIAPESVTALLVTHEHTDHVKGLSGAVERWGWECHSTKGTRTMCEDLKNAGGKTFIAGAKLSFSDMEVQTLKSSHDAAEPIVFVATSLKNGARVGVAYDLGVVNLSVLEAFRELDMMFIESNHDEVMLRNGPYAVPLQNRISGNRGHLSNGAAARFAASTAHRGLNHIVLMHLSEKCNKPELATQAVTDGVTKTKFRGKISAANQWVPSGPFMPGASRPTAIQLGLSL